MTYPENEDDIVDAWVFNREGQIVHRISPPEQFYGTRLPEISRNGEYCCYPILSRELAVYNCFDGTPQGLLEATNPGRNLQIFSFSPDGEYLCAGGHSGGKVLRTENLEQVWLGPLPELVNEYSIVHCSEDASIISCIIKRGDYPDYYYEQYLFRDEEVIYSNTINSNSQIEAVVAPRGNFLLIKDENNRYGRTSLPMTIQMLCGGE